MIDPHPPLSSVFFHNCIFIFQDFYFVPFSGCNEWIEWNDNILQFSHSLLFKDSFKSGSDKLLPLHFPFPFLHFSNSAFQKLTRHHLLTSLINSHIHNIALCFHQNCHYLCILCGKNYAQEIRPTLSHHIEWPFSSSYHYHYHLHSLHQLLPPSSLTMILLAMTIVMDSVSHLAKVTRNDCCVLDSWSICNLTELSCLGY